ncbi:tRNA 2-thiouridine synthesizing protein A [Palleronia aestuarii]|uniref:tRNA 2-thiouridine synthesizing protein A n=1 Tax=Palleronia aestuarii TaxID=568105 RepID=A0A2W7N0N6_9RHOB|nr:sulfurtransferase TusA family protein [Palleronia aestuarii]PZX13630.1 tRNA 2-thiouridine synthesizing protein A [Palleronia aestuarii]
MNFEPDVIDLDARGLLCPLPVLKLRKRIAGMETGQVLRVLVDDPAAIVDIPHFCAESGCEIVGSEEAADCRLFLVRRGS